MAQYIQGDVARLALTATNDAGTPVDLSNLLLKVKFPDGTITPYSGGIVHVTTGSYYYDLQLVQEGSYTLQWQSDGDTQGAVNDTLFVYAAAIP